MSDHRKIESLKSIYNLNSERGKKKKKSKKMLAHLRLHEVNITQHFKGYGLKHTLRITHLPSNIGKTIPLSGDGILETFAIWSFQIADYQNDSLSIVLGESGNGKVCELARLNIFLNWFSESKVTDCAFPMRPEIEMQVPIISLSVHISKSDEALRIFNPSKHTCCFPASEKNHPSQNRKLNKLSENEVKQKVEKEAERKVYDECENENSKCHTKINQNYEFLSYAFNDPPGELLVTPTWNSKVAFNRYSKTSYENDEDDEVEIEININDDTVVDASDAFPHFETNCSSIKNIGSMPSTFNHIINDSFTCDVHKSSKILPNVFLPSSQKSGKHANFSLGIKFNPTIANRRKSYATKSSKTLLPHLEENSVILNYHILPNKYNVDTNHDNNVNNIKANQLNFNNIDENLTVNEKIMKAKSADIPILSQQSNNNPFIDNRMLITQMQDTPIVHGQGNENEMKKYESVPILLSRCHLIKRRHSKAPLRVPFEMPKSILKNKL
ncbi:hypothetical protein TRFO_15965 [Tritrichomonas foetus]|uniref:Uncharacterized protein n=1 Tax=Tritrichomonas foetus TaxID=1144522 RepID=A0A1J4KSH2_9EUKA|nr:hypothetical protein TRFO_15965 [Tritrichomonas foetus]|eukprot:OHT13832.1 hypothetical protein TRFO_15965 [Tritrichomonas foetus]